MTTALRSILFKKQNQEPRTQNQDRRLFHRFFTMRHAVEVVLLLIPFIVPVCLVAQTPDIAIRNVIVTTPDSVIKTSVWNSAMKQKIQPKYHYYWYYSGLVNHNVGGYSGKLLHGKYEVFDNQQKLRLKGMFDYGLMTGNWTRWYPNGNKQSAVFYKNGILEGKAETYTPEGKLALVQTYEKGMPDGETETYTPDGRQASRLAYNNGVLHGKCYYFLRDTTITKVFRQGKEVVKPVKPKKEKNEKKKEPREKKKKPADKEKQQQDKQLTPSKPQENPADQPQKKKWKWRPFTKQASHTPGSI